MSTPGNRPRRNVVGPQSALTDFLASHNISARQIRLDAEARRRAAQELNGQDPPAQEQNGDATATTTTDPAATPAPAASPTVDELAAQAKRKRDQASAIEKIKASKKFKNKKRKRDDDDDDDDLALAIFEERAAPMPGQMENCGLCRKRFTVTAYTRAGPDGGLLCNPCGKELDKNEKAAAGKAKAPKGGSGRRKVQSKILSGTYRIGAKSLMTLCIQTLANNIHLAEDLGDLPEPIIDKISRELSRRRLLDSNTLNLFLQPTFETLRVYDGAKLQLQDMMRILQTMPNLKNLKLRNAIQFKDSVMEYLISRDINLKGLQLHGSNLISEALWIKFIENKGSSLETLQIYFTDKHVTDKIIPYLHKHAPNLKRLKIVHNEALGTDGVREMGNLSRLEHLSLNLHKKVHADVFIDVLGKIGPGLHTFSIEEVPHMDNTVLDAIHAKCRSLRKLRITDSEVMTDEGFVRLFKDWENKPLTFLDLQKCRHVSDEGHRTNTENVGLCSNGFKALMEHSGRELKHLNVHACRHISAAAFEDAFGPDKRYPNLVDLEISFCEQVTDFIVGSIFRSCPNLKKINVFGCMKVKSVRIPRGKILVGVPTAIGMLTEG